MVNYSDTMQTLLIVDLQNDFMEGGALPIQGGRALIPLINRLQPYFDLIVTCRDWHPPNHCSFAENHAGKQPGKFIEVAGCLQKLWPAHCVQDTPGAEFAAGLDSDRWEKVFSKGTDPKIDSYSAFFDNAKRRNTGLTEYFRARGVAEFHVVGVATDYCVKFSVLDALELGFQPIVILDGTQGINSEVHDVEKACLEMQQAGASMILSKEIIPSKNTAP
jgi:nicotinamidase/pyrazinamidase